MQSWLKLQHYTSIRLLIRCFTSPKPHRAMPRVPNLQLQFDKQEVLNFDLSADLCWPQTRPCLMTRFIKGVKPSAVIDHHGTNERQGWWWRWSCQSLDPKMYEMSFDKRPCHFFNESKTNFLSHHTFFLISKENDSVVWQYIKVLDEISDRKHF